MGWRTGTVKGSLGLASASASAEMHEHNEIGRGENEEMTNRSREGRLTGLPTFPRPDRTI